MKNKNSHAQIWIETAVYTLIGLAIIAILLTIVTPQIEKIKDKSILEQTITALETINLKIIETEQASGSIGIVYLTIAKGKFEINSQNNSLIYILENTKLEFSEIGEELQEGNLIIKTEKFGSRFKTTLALKYDEIELTYNSQETPKVLQAGSAPYKLKIENIGDQDINEPIHIDFSLI